MSELLLDAAGVVAHPRPCPASAPDVRRATKACAIRPIRRPSRRSSPSCGQPATIRTGADCAGSSSSCGERGCVSTKPSPSTSPTWTADAARYSCGAARADAAARSAWTSGPGSNCSRGSTCASSCPSARSSASSTVPRAAAHGPRQPPAPTCAERPRPPACGTLRAASAAPRPRARGCSRGGATHHHPAPARSQHPRRYLDLSPRHRQRRDHRHRPRAPRADDPRQHIAPAVNNSGPPCRSSRIATLRSGRRRTRSSHMEGRSADADVFGTTPGSR
jgi:hypothetical protein